TLAELGFTEEVAPRGVFVKESVFPFARFPGEDPLLGPEMRSTGEVMGMASGFGEAFAKAQIAAGSPLPDGGRAFLSVNDFDKPALVAIARDVWALGFALVATRGTAEFLQRQGIAAERVFKAGEGRPNIVDRILSGEIHLIVNTPLGGESFFDEPAIRKTATM